MTNVIYNCLFLGWKQKTAKQRSLKHNVWTARFHRGFWSRIADIPRSDLHNEFLLPHVSQADPDDHDVLLFVTIPQDTPPGQCFFLGIPSRRKTNGALHVCIYWLFIIYILLLTLSLIIFIITITIFYLLLISCLFIICYKIYKLFAIYYLLSNVHCLSFVISCLLLFMIHDLLVFVVCLYIY